MNDEVYRLPRVMYGSIYMSIQTWSSLVYMCVLVFTYWSFLKVDMSKVNLDVIKPWITERITEILKFEDDVVIEYCFNLLEKNQVCTAPWFGELLMRCRCMFSV